MECGVDPKVFRAVSTVDVEAILKCTDAELRPVLACLVRMSLIAPLDQSKACLQGRTAVLQVLSRIELVNTIVALLSIDFHALEIDVKKEQQLRQKAGSSSGDSVLIQSLPSGPSLEFERSDATRKLRLVLSELLAIMGKIHSAGPKEDGSSSERLVIKPSELFDHQVYLAEICDVLAIALAELPALLQPTEVAEALLRLKFGAAIICHIVGNQSDSFFDVASHLLKNGEKQDEDGVNTVRQNALLQLCRMNPSLALAIRARCTEWCKMPSLAILLTLEHSSETQDENDIVCFISGLLLGSDPQCRSWISFFVRNGQKRRCEALAALRTELERRVQNILQCCKERRLPSALVLQASTLLRLYTALRGIAGLKFSETEVRLLLELITVQPPASPAGIKFVSLGLSMLIACNSLIAHQYLEKQAVDWIKWLVREETYFEATRGVDSYLEMLLLCAIHFHAGQLSAVADLVCQTLGMKIAIRTNNMSRIKQIFTNEIFTDSVVAAHAVRVPVTPNLSANTTGTLPVHCIHQLLKNRVFSKHRVSIKSWIYRQICSSSSPLHPILPQLIDVYVTSILVPSSTRAAYTEHLNEPLTEAEIRQVFSKNVFFTASPTYRTPHRHSRSSTPASPHQNRSSRSRTPQTLDPGDALAAQLLMLYYILLYEDVRLSNMRNVSVTNRTPHRYSADLLSELPLKFLLSAAESQQDRFGGLFPSLLKLCTTHFPHLCLVEDWLRADEARPSRAIGTSSIKPTKEGLASAFANLSECPTAAALQLQQLLDLPPYHAWPLAETLVANIKTVLSKDAPRQVQELYKDVWINLNSVFPRKLWLLTVNALTPDSPGPPRCLTQDELSLDPLSALRCDFRVFRVGPLLSIVIYVLKACLAACRTRLGQHLLEKPTTAPPPGQPPAGDIEREELKIALVATQESAAIQILLESCVPEDHERGEDSSRLAALQEVQSLVCCYLHEAFIADPNLAKLVHFQGYPVELLGVTVAGVPSMHICLDFAPELLSQPSLDKQVFAIDLISHLSVQYALPKALSTARLAVNTLSTLFSVLASESRTALLVPVLPSLVRICRAFPPLIEDCISFLLQAGRMWISSSSLQGYCSPKNFDMSSDNEKMEEICGVIRKIPGDHPVSQDIVNSFEQILGQTVLAKKLF